MRRAWAGGIAVALAWRAVSACGGDDTVAPADGGASDGTLSGDSGDAGDQDASSAADSNADVVPFDAGPHPDGGQPVVACGDAGDAALPDGGDPCFEAQPSRCVDDTWFVYYYNGTCVAGACQYTAGYYACDPGVEGKCINGGCEHPVLR